MEDRIKTIIKKDLKSKVRSMEKINEGYSHFNYLVKISKSPGEVILRFSNNIGEEESLLKEKYVIELLRKNNLPVPKILAFHFPEKDRKKGYMIISKIPGERLDKIWYKLTKKEKELVAEKIGRLMRDMHKIKFNSFGKIKEKGDISEDISFKFKPKGEKKETDPCLRNILKDFFIDFSRIASYDEVKNNQLSKISKYITSKKELLKNKEKPVFNHGDLMPGHIFVKKFNNDWKITGIIDFEQAEAYSREKDFIKLHRNKFFEIPELKKALLRGYKEKIDEEKIKLLRIMRDLQFSFVVRDSGSKELSDKKMNEFNELIKKKTIKHNDFPEFP